MPFDRTIAEKFREAAQREFDNATSDFEVDNFVSATFGELRDADTLTLDHVATSHGAAALINAVAHECVRSGGWTTKRRKQAQIDGDRRLALEAVVGGVLGAAARKGWQSTWVRRSHEQSQFTGRRVSRKRFEDAAKATESLGLIERKVGFNNRKTGIRYASRYRATPQLLENAKEHGIDGDSYADHFRREPEVFPLILKSSHKENSGSKRLRIEWTDETAVALRQEVELVNAVVAETDVEGSDLRGFQRVFNFGDMDGHDWRFGGRVFAVSADPRSYQQLKKEQRRSLKLNGHRLREIDIGSCFLTIALAHLGETDRDYQCDLYAAFDDLPRPIVKAWMTCFFGKGVPLKSWPKDVVERVEKREKENPRAFKLPEITARVFEAFPSLRSWESVGLTCQEMMRVESDVVFGTTVEFAKEGILLLPVHDSLLVPDDLVDEAKGRLVDRFFNKVGVVPRI